VIDITFEGIEHVGRSVHRLFFSLVANQQGQFDTILKWTSDNLTLGRGAGDRLGWLGIAR
jgi:endo-1,4-beta-D-glucanase Y